MLSTCHRACDGVVNFRRALCTAAVGYQMAQLRGESAAWRGGRSGWRNWDM